MTPVWLRTLGALLGLLLSAGVAHAQVLAHLDRNPVELGQTVVLTIEAADAVTAPDLNPLRRDFEVLGERSSRSQVINNGAQNTRTVYTIDLQPRRTGSVLIPALSLGTRHTDPIALTVHPASATSQTDGNGNGDDAFLEIEIDTASPYVQQSVGVVLRLLYAVPLISGELDLETPQGASLQRVGNDIKSHRDLHGRRYDVVERRFLLVPERSGPLTLPAARFIGRLASGGLNDWLGNGGDELRIAGTSRALSVREQPAGAPQPWLPLRDLHLRYVGAPTTARVGEAANVVIEGLALGATQAQLPQMPTLSVPGAQVFAEPVKYEETFAAGSPQVKWTQRYAVVPDRPGALNVVGLEIPWWDVSTGTAKKATLPDLPLKVAAGTGAPAAVAGISPNTLAPAADMDSPASLSERIWPWLAVAFAGLWLITLIWALQQRRTWQEKAQTSHVPSDRLSRRSLPDLKRTLDTGSLDEVAQVLCQMAYPLATDLDDLITRLQAPEQREALEQLRRARWGGGDGSAARSALRIAFAKGPTWKRVVLEQDAASLPPLYPPP